MLDERDYRSLYKVFPFVAGSIDRTTEYERTAPMKRKHTYCGEVVANVTEIMDQWAR